MYAVDLVLIAIDMQRAFDMPGRPRRWNNDLDSNGLQVLAAWRARRLPIIQFRNDDPDPRSWSHADHPGCAFRPGFEPLPGEGLVVKSVNSAFIGTDLDLRLRRLDAAGIVLFGMRTDMCVSSTARTGSNIGWEVSGRTREGERQRVQPTSQADRDPFAPGPVSRRTTCQSRRP